MTQGHGRHWRRHPGRPGATRTRDAVRIRCMELYNWEQLPAEQMNAMVVRKVIHTGQMTIARLNIRKDAVVPVHSHINEQVANVERGSLLFHIGGVDQVVGPGESLVIPPNVPHGVVALEDTVVTDVFTPRREDWISGDDAYLRR
jgi:quercetin dioxygenase-like cupin family protein